MTRVSSDGFSLVEMLAALLVAALAISVLAGSFNPRHRMPTANDLAKRVAVDAAALGAQSTATGTTRQLIVDVKSRTIKLGMVTVDVPDNLTLIVKTGAELISQDSKGSILFFADGTSRDGEITLSDSSGASATVSIDWITGTVKLEKPQT